MNKAELSEDPKQRAQTLSEAKQKWFFGELEGLMGDCFGSGPEWDKFLKTNFNESSLRSYFDME